MRYITLHCMSNWLAVDCATVVAVQVWLRLHFMADFQFSNFLQKAGTLRPDHVYVYPTEDSK